MTEDKDGLAQLRKTFAQADLNAQAMECLKELVELWDQDLLDAVDNNAWGQTEAIQNIRSVCAAMRRARSLVSQAKELEAKNDVG